MICFCCECIMGFVAATILGKYECICLNMPHINKPHLPQIFLEKKYPFKNSNSVYGFKRPACVQHDSVFNGRQRQADNVREHSVAVHGATGPPMYMCV